jgi:hypothetical protein
MTLTILFIGALVLVALWFAKRQGKYSKNWIKK